MEFIAGLFGSLVGVGLFLFGIWFARQLDGKEKTPPVEVPEDEKREILEQRERLIQEQKAFRELMNYNANMAYGVKTTE